MSRRRKIAVRLLAGALLVSTGIYAAAMWDMARERGARRYLGDRLYAEVRGNGDPVVFLSGLQGSTRFWIHPMCAFRPLLRVVLPKLVRNHPPEVVSDSVLHELGAVDGAVRILLTTPIAPFIRQLGPRVTFIHGRADRVTPLADVEQLARAAGARVLIADSDHHHYLTNVRDAIAAEITRTSEGAQP